MPHTRIEADCVNPVRCEVCGTTKGTALGHTWNPATCEKAKCCELCGTNEGVPLGHNWVNETATFPHMCTNCNLMDPREWHDHFQRKADMGRYPDDS